MASPSWPAACQGEEEDTGAGPPSDSDQAEPLDGGGGDARCAGSGVFSLDFFLGWRRKQQSVRIWRRGGGLASGASRGAPNFRDGGGGASRVLFDPLWGLGAALEVDTGGGSISGTRWVCFRRSAAGAQHRGHNANDGRRTLVEVMMIFVGFGWGVENWGTTKGEEGTSTSTATEEPPGWATRAPSSGTRLSWWNRRVVGCSGGVCRLAQAEINESSAGWLGGDWEKGGGRFCLRDGDLGNGRGGRGGGRAGVR